MEDEGYTKYKIYNSSTSLSSSSSSQSIDCTNHWLVIGGNTKNSNECFKEYTAHIPMYRVSHKKITTCRADEHNF